MIIQITDFEKEKIKSFFSGGYNIQDVLSYIDKVTHIYHYTYNNLTIKVYYINKIDQLNIKKIKRTIKRAFLVIDNYNNVKSFIINLILSPLKKEFVYNEMFTEKNINSGFTFHNKNEIFIFRKEEYPKVIIHELLHHQLLIDNQHFKHENKIKLMDHFNIHHSTKLILNETIIETWAMIVYLYLISKEYNLNLKTLFDVEFKYSMLKTYQLLKLQETYKNKQWIDRANIYAYIIFKFIIMSKLQDFLAIYTFPHDDSTITNFIIDNSNVLNDLKKKNPENPFFIINKIKIQRPLNSLCFMLLSDL
jgi:hypothetical protein